MKKNIDVLACVVLVFACVSTASAVGRTLAFTERDGQLDITAADTIIATYVYRDPEISRPYFAHVRTLDGIQVTRNHPPQVDDPEDHATFHPGIWLAFGDISGTDFWRNKAEVKHRRFDQPPTVQADGALVFSVENVYIDGGKIICTETCNYRISAEGEGWMLRSDSTFEALVQPVVFGDQEEMGFGVRMATPLAVLKGGAILNSEGAKNEAGVWGKAAQWADYSGVIGKSPVGVAVLAHPGNFRPSWFHARDYGLLVANPFGQKAFTEGEPSRVTVEPGTPLRLRFGAFIHGAASEDQLKKAYNEFVAEVEKP